MPAHAPIHALIRLRELRVMARLGGKQLARQADIPAWVIYQIETGRCNPLLHRERLKKVAKVLGTTLVEVLRPATEAAKMIPKNLRPGAEVPNLPAVVKKTRPPAPAAEDVPPRRGRPLSPAMAGEMVEISIAVGGNLIGGIQTRDTKAMRAILRDMFGGDDG